MKTAVEWLIEKLNINGTVIPMEIEYLAKEMEYEQRRKDYIKGKKDGIQYESMINYDSDCNDEAENFAKKAEEKFIKSIN
jgi:hypothetical protein